MPVILRKLPFFNRVTTRPVPGGTVPILPYQIVLSVSIAPTGEEELHPRALRFPAVLDTGFNKAFLLREEHLNQWAGLRREHLRQIGEITAYGQKVPLFRGNLWFHRNVAGWLEEASNLSPFCVDLNRGIAVCPAGMTQPRLPLLGLRGLAAANVQLSFHWWKRLVSIRTTPWWHRFFW